MICYAEKRFFEWYEDDQSVSLRASGGSYGGGSEVLVIESNQNHATITDTEVCTTLPASMGMGGGLTPMVVEECSIAPVCLDNHPNDSRITIRQDGIAQSLTSRCGTGGNNVPLVMIIKN